MKGTLCTAVVVAAGSSSRMGGNVRKPYLSLNGKPILSWTLQALTHVFGLHQIVLVTRPDDRETALAAAQCARLPGTIRLDCAEGGARRQDSVWNGLKATLAESELVLIHDAARPFPPPNAMWQACLEAKRIGAAILACRVKDTVKRQADQNSPVPDPLIELDEAPPAIQIEGTVPRAGLWLAQTPQVFQRALILSLFERLALETVPHELTDDASVCELFGQPVGLIESSETNLKVTRPEDVLIAEAYLKMKRTTRLR